MMSNKIAVFSFNKANLRDLIAATGLVSNLTQIGFKSLINQPL